MTSLGLKRYLAKPEATLLLVFRVALGGLFIYASLDKIWNPGLFAKAIANYRILPLSLLHLSAIIMPWLELITGLALISNKYTRAANLIILAMLAAFTLSIMSAMFRGLDFNCGCFDLDAAAKNVGMMKVIQNMGLIGMSLLIELIFRRRRKTQPPTASH